MKLKLKHPAAYLPYGLKVKWGADTANLIGLIRSAVVLNCEQWNESQKTGIENVKLILHPLSDLTKEIEVNGEKFIPVDRLEKLYCTLDYRNKCIQLTKDDRWVSQCDYMLIGHLISWHFDIFGLIDAGLAVDINSVKF